MKSIILKLAIVSLLFINIAEAGNRVKRKVTKNGEEVIVLEKKNSSGKNIRKSSKVIRKSAFKPTHKKSKTVYKNRRGKTTKVVTHHPKRNRKVVTYKKPLKTTKIHRRPRYRSTKVITYNPRHHKRRVITHRRSNYRYHNGLFSIAIGGTYRSCVAPLGIRVRYLPRRYKRVVISNRTYYHHNNTYYVYDNDEYVVVKKPDTYIVYNSSSNNDSEVYSSNTLDISESSYDNLPDRAKVVEFDGRVYYKVDGNYYKAVSQGNNIMYEIVLAD